MPVYMGEEEAIRKNMELAQEKMHTAEEIEGLPEDVRVELLDGQLYYMATPSRRHQELVGMLCTAFYMHVKGKKGACKVYPAPFAVYLNKDNRTYLEPDLVIVCDPGKLDEKGCHGAPDMVVEIVSPSTRSRDYLLKLTRYQNAGVREYWIVDPERERVMVYDFTGGKVRDYTFGDTITVGIFPDLEVDFSQMVLE